MQFPPMVRVGLLNLKPKICLTASCLNSFPRSSVKLELPTIMKKILKKSTLLPELVIDILLRLPVSSLLRFRCLSRSLCTEIDSENFVKDHLNGSIQRKTRQKLIIYNDLVFGQSNDFYFADFDDGLVDAFPLNEPLRSRHHASSVYGSCNGLILLVLGMDLEDKYQSLDLAIWNPFTRRYKKLPICPVQTLPGYRGFDCSGLGYDSAHDDYKIVKISRVDESSQVWVFGLKSDFWRRSRDLEDEVSISVGRYANGALYWLCKSKNKFVGFDLAKEVFFDIPQLSDYGPATTFYDSLVVFGGNLYFPTLHGKTVEYYFLVSDVSYKDGEVVGVSWRKEFTMENVEKIIETGYKFRPPWPLAYSKDGDSILLDELNGVFWHNLENKTKKRVNIAGLPRVCWFGYSVCWESLVSVGKHSAFDGAAEEVMIENLEE